MVMAGMGRNMVHVGMRGRFWLDAIQGGCLKEVLYNLPRAHVENLYVYVYPGTLEVQTTMHRQQHVSVHEEH